MESGRALSPAQLFVAAVGERVMIYRLCRTMEPEHLAQKVGLSAKQLHDLEGGRFDPSLTMLQAIADELGTSVQELFRFEPSPVTETFDGGTQKHP